MKKQSILIVTILFSMVYMAPAQNANSPSDFVNPLIGAAGRGSCMAGPCLPHSSYLSKS